MNVLLPSTMTAPCLHIVSIWWAHTSADARQPWTPIHPGLEETVRVSKRLSWHFPLPWKVEISCNFLTVLLLQLFIQLTKYIEMHLWSLWPKENLSICESRPHTLVVLKVMPPINFCGNNNGYKEQKNHYLVEQILCYKILFFSTVTTINYSFSQQQARACRLCM